MTQDARHVLDKMSGEHEQPRWRERQVSALAELALRALQEADLDGVLSFGAERLRVALDCDFTKIIDARSSADGLLVRAGSGWPAGVVGNAEVADGMQSQAGYTMERREPVIVVDSTTEERFAPAQLLQEHGIRSGISVVIAGQPDDYGVLQADSRQPGWFEPQDIVVMQAYANVVAIIIEQRDREQLGADFAAIAAHELRTPLTLLMGYSSTLLDLLDRTGSIGADHREEVEMLYGESLRLRRAVDTYLALGEIERRSVAPSLVHVDLVDTINAVLAEVRLRYPDVDVDVQRPERPLKRLTDEVSVQRIISNLVENGIKYSPPGAAITVQLARETDGTDTVRVLDRCGGLSDSDMRRLFRHSYRGERSGLGSGLGLGLYVSQRLSERIGGNLSAENTDIGCAFMLRLPGSTSSRTPTG